MFIVLCSVIETKLSCGNVLLLKQCIYLLYKRKKTPYSESPLLNNIHLVAAEDITCYRLVPYLSGYLTGF